MRLATTAALAVTLLTSATTAHAQNLVANPGFEAGANGYTFTGAFTGVRTAARGVGAPYGGFRFAAFGSIEDLGTASQTIATTPGGAYTFRFYLANLNGGREPNNSFAVQFGSETVLSLVDAADFGYQLYSYDVVATDASTTLTFAGRNAPSYFNLDDVSVTPSTVTPEPATFALLGAGLAGVATAARRRRAPTA